MAHKTKRPPRAPNHSPRQVFADFFEQLGRKSAFIKWARANPTDPIARKTLALLAAVDRELHGGGR